MREHVLILDFGSQYTQLIARRIRELGVYCEVVPYTAAGSVMDVQSIKKRSPAALILSGGPSSVYSDGSPRVDKSLFEIGVPILGICYGLQLMAQSLGGKVERSDAREYGTANLEVVDPSGILRRFGRGQSIPVWMSHGDKICMLPPGFSIQGVSENTPYCAVSDESRRLYGIQFHPEVSHTKMGSDFLATFLHDIANIRPSWDPKEHVNSLVEQVSEQIGDGTAICALSGGVDSAVAALICHKAIGSRLTCVFVDNGLLRSGEFEQVLNMFQGRFGLNVVGVDAGRKFLEALNHAGQDPERKRKCIGRAFIEVFEEYVKETGTSFLVQGTIYPDVIESIPHRGPSSTIKSHHNVGGLPKRMKMRLVEPLREFFKDEVRGIGLSMGMPEEFVRRQPFPGPGLAIRCIGPVTERRLGTLRSAESILDAEIRAAGLYSSLWQSFCVLLPVKSVGVMGDERTYEETCVIRAVTSVDGMTADWARLPYDLVSRISSRIINEVVGINRVVLDVSSKPPATIEWE